MISFIYPATTNSTLAGSPCSNAHQASCDAAGIGLKKDLYSINVASLPDAGPAILYRLSDAEGIKHL